jgi:hypothetical protein
MALIFGMLFPDFYGADDSKFVSPKRYPNALHGIASQSFLIAGWQMIRP